MNSTENPKTESISYHVERGIMPKYSTVQDRQYKVKSIEHGPPVNTKIEAYKNFINNWDVDGLNWIKEFKTLVLDKDNTPIYLVSFEPFEKITRAHINKIFQIIKDLRDAKSVIVGQNSPDKSVIPNKKDNNLAKTFLSVAEEFEVPVVQQLIMSNNALYEL